MNFAYLDPHELLEQVLGVEPDPIEPVPYTIDESWKTFEKELEKFKLEYMTARHELAMTRTELDHKKQDIFHGRSAVEAIRNPGLKARIESIVDEYVVNEGVTELTEKVKELMGKADALGRVLKDTNAERYASFICFVCMERPVDTFLDPCGHVMCERCWARTPVRNVGGPDCPGCRSRVRNARKIFTLS